MDVDKMAYVFIMEEFTTTLSALRDTVESVQERAAVPDAGKPSRGNIPPLLPLHNDLTCTADGDVGAEVLAASADGKVGCSLCILEMDPKKLLQYMAGHILEKEVRLVHAG